MRVYQVILSLFFKPWRAEVFVVDRGETVPIGRPFVSENGKVVFVRSGSEFFLNKDDMPPIKPGQIVRL